MASELSLPEQRARLEEYRKRAQAANIGNPLSSFLDFFLQANPWILDLALARLEQLERETNKNRMNSLDYWQMRCASCHEVRALHSGEDGMGRCEITRCAAFSLSDSPVTDGEALIEKLCGPLCKHCGVPAKQCDCMPEEKGNQA